MGQEDGAGAEMGDASGGGPPATPRWVKVSGLVALVVLAVLVAVLVFGDGDHGPGRHAPMDGGGIDATEGTATAFFVGGRTAGGWVRSMVVASDDGTVPERRGYGPGTVPERRGETVAAVHRVS